MDQDKTHTASVLRKESTKEDEEKISAFDQESLD